MTTHTITLLQPSRSLASRTFLDHDTLSLALEHLIHMYEDYLKHTHPHQLHLTYNVADLLEWIGGQKGGLVDCTMLVFNPQTREYTPHDKEWIKSKLANHLKRSYDRDVPQQQHQYHGRR